MSAERAVLDGGFNGAQDALDRMARAHARGTGCHLTAEMIQSLGVSMIGQMWAEDRPKAAGDCS